MTTKITVPDIGDFENVEIIEILAKPGQVINKNDPVVTLESDKSSVEVPSPFEGKISSIEVKIGDKVSKGTVLALIEGEKEIKKEPIKEVKKIEKKAEDVLSETEKIIKQAESTIEPPIKKETVEKIYPKSNDSDIDPTETQEWLDSLDAVLKKDGVDRADYLLKN